jgi:hypothetical protein
MYTASAARYYIDRRDAEVSGEPLLFPLSICEAESTCRLSRQQFAGMKRSMEPVAVNVNWYEAAKSRKSASAGDYIPWNRKSLRRPQDPDWWRRQAAQQMG